MIAQVKSSNELLTAVRDMCANMVAPPLDVTPFKVGDIVMSKAGNRYKLVKARGMKGMFQCKRGYQVCNGVWSQRQLELAGVRKV